MDQTADTPEHYLPSRWRGLGAIAVACGWAAAGWYYFNEIGTQIFVMQISQMVARGVVQQEAVSPLGALGWTSPPPPNARGQRGVAQRPPNPAPRPRVNHVDLQFRPDIAEGARQGWAVLTSVLCGVMLSSGVAMLFRGRGKRALYRWLCDVLCWGGWGAVIALRYAKFSRLGWPSYLLELTQMRYNWATLLLVAMTAALFTAAVASAPRLRPGRWSATMIAVSFLGTFATLAALGVLIQYAGFPPLPSWIYIATALAQSLWAWVLLITESAHARTHA